MEAPEEAELLAQIFYCFREKYYSSMLSACKEGMSKFRNNVSMHLFNALALMLNGRVEESVNELDSIKLENDVKLAAIIALMYGHKLLGVSNKDLFVKLDAQMRELRKSANATDFYHSGFVLFVLNKLEKAADYLDKALSLQPDLLDAVTLKAWILLYLKKSGLRSSQNITELFESALLNNKRNLDATLGLTESHLFLNRVEDAIDAVNKAVVRFPDSQLPLIEKMKIQLASQEWDLSIETMNRVLASDQDDLAALRVNIIILLCRDVNYDEAVDCIKKYLGVIAVKESRNYKLMVDSAQLFSKICGRHPGVLSETFRMVEKAVQINPEDVEAVVELGYQCLLSGHIKEALKYYKSATKIDNSSLKALMGLTLCELSENGNSDQVKKQVEFLLELEEAPTSPQLHLVRAKLAESASEALDFLKKACDLQLLPIKTYPYSDSYLRLLDPDFLLDVVREYLQYISSYPEHGKNLSKFPESVLKTITKACPGLYEPLFLLAKLQFFSGETANAMNNLDQILAKIEDRASDAHLLMAQMQVQSGLYERAAQSLEMGLSHDFKVRENPIYHYIRGLVDKHTNNMQDAVRSLTTALTLVNVSPATTTYRISDQGGLTLTERASIYIELIEVHNVVGQTDEAAKLLEDALAEFQNTPEEARILILSADHAIKRHNVQSAIDLLGKIKTTESYYLQARTKLADIMLKCRMDKYAYLQCYQEMVDENPGSETYILLGDAYMNILEPDDALECYRKALQQDSKDPYLTSKMGKALVDTHYFAKAVTFYKEAIKTTDNSELKLALADLYLQLKEYDKAEMLLVTEIESEKSKNLEDLTYLQYKTKLMVLLAQTQEKSGNTSGALATLKDAKDNQNRVKRRLAVEQTNVPETEIKLLVEIGAKLAEISMYLKNRDQAINFYKEAVEAAPNDIGILVALAKLYMQVNLLEPCQQICTNILKIDAENDTASVMLADIAFRKIDFDMALFHFTQLIIKQPTNWAALVRLVEIARRTGNLDDVPDYLSNAEKICENPSKDPGFLFCTGLYQWYSGNLNGALRSFNGARQDPEWGQTALYNMIEICLNPDDEMLGDQFIDSDDSEYRDSRTMALKTAERLLKEYKQRLEANGEDMLKYRLLVNFRLLATQDKHNIERGLEDFIAIASHNIYKEHVGPILGMSTAYTLLKQSQRAKNQLKRVAKFTWTFEDAEYLERCWLLLSDHYIQSAKFEVASELLNKVVQHNKTSSKAYEHLGFISEKEQHYKNAVSNYENAWRFGGKSNPSVGYKLAYNLMKCKNYADAIDIGQQVLKLNPDYPKVKKDILDKSMNNLRV